MFARRITLVTLTVLLLLVFGILPASSLAAMNVLYPAPRSEDDTRDAYKVELLKAVLDATVPTHGPYTLQSSTQPIPTKRLAAMVSSGRISLLYSTTSHSLEQQLLPIRIPIMKGLLGKRVLLIRKERQREFNDISTLEQLKKYSVGQGLGWEDVDIFEHHGFTVVTSPYYESLFQMLSRGRYDFFSRGVTEAYQELEERKHTLPELDVEQTILLEYQFPVYFFVAKDNIALAERISAGLEMIRQQGVFDIIFNHYYGHLIQQANLKQRKVFPMNNPHLPLYTQNIQ